MNRLAAAIMWVFFSIGAILSIGMLAITIIVGDVTVTKRIGMASDRLTAAVLGFSGKYTLSAELAVSSRMRWLYSVLNKFEEGHCEKAAFSEGMLDSEY